MSEKLAALKQKLQSVDKFAIFCANDFACLLVQYCGVNGLMDKIVNVLVTRKGEWRHTPPHILGVPVAELQGWDQPKDILIVVAFLGDNYEGINRIKASMFQAGYDNVYFMSEDEFKGLNESLADFSADINFLLRKLTVKVEDLSLLVQGMPMVVETHKKSFSKYKDVHKGETIVVCGSGPSLNRYKYNPNYIHIGVNELIFQDRIKLDYFFQQDLPQKSNIEYKNRSDEVNFNVSKKYIDRLQNTKCVKFLARFLTTYPYVAPLPFSMFVEGEYNNYWVAGHEGTRNFFPDIRYNLLYGSWSTIFPALQFALFTNPKRILIVGTDGYDAEAEDNHFTKDGKYTTGKPQITEQINLMRWNKGLRGCYCQFKDMADVHYPETEIYMVNPKHFKGIFKEMLTDEDGNLIEP